MNKITKIKNRYIGEGYPTYIIAEMSANHAMDINNALKIIHLAREAGADCIKIQTYTPDTITLNCANDYFKVKEGMWKGETLYQLYGKAYTPWEWQARLKEEADNVGIDFFSTPFDKTAVDFLENIGVEFYKIASFEVVDIPLIKYTASKKKPIIMSTGLATFDEIEDAVNAVKTQGNNDLCLLKCSSAYPAIPEDMNLKTMQSLAEVFGVPVGLSDHSLGSLGAVTAVALGANIIEKHFCISRDIPNPDSSFSMEPDEFKKMVDEIRTVEKAVGKVSYEISDMEKASRVFRKSIFVAENIKKGQEFNGSNLKVVRPGDGIKPKYYESILGKKAVADIEKGTPLNFDMVQDFKPKE